MRDDLAILPNFGRTNSKTGEDSAKYQEILDNPAIVVESDNGYAFSRPRYTRRARRDFTTGFTHLTDIQKQTLEQFYVDRMGGVEPFYYELPVTKDMVAVRFTDKLTFKYVGMGGVHLWDVDFTIKEV